MSMYKNIIEDQALLRNIIRVEQNISNAEYYEMVCSLGNPIKKDTLFWKALQEVLKIDRAGEISAGQLPVAIEALLIYEEDKTEYIDTLWKKLNKM